MRGRGGTPTVSTPRVRGALEESRQGFDKAVFLREFLGRYEEDLEEWRQRVTSRVPHGRRWRALIASCHKTIADAGSLYFQIRNEEHAALELLRKAVSEIRGLEEETEDRGAGDGDPAEVLEESARIRSEELELLDEAIQYTHRILNLAPEVTPDEMLYLLDERDRHMARVGSRVEACEALEREAAEMIGSEKEADMLKPQEAAAAKPDADEEPTPGEEAEAVEDRAAGSGAAGSGVAGSGVAGSGVAGSGVAGSGVAGSGVPEEDPAPTAERGRDEDAPVPEALAARTAPPAAPAAPPADAIGEELGEGIASLSRIAADVQGKIDALRGALARAEERAEEAEAENRELQSRLTEAEALADRLEETLRSREEEIEEELADSEAQLRDAQRERDEALVLVTSLSRRLGTPGLESQVGLDDPKRPARKAKSSKRK